MSRAIDDADRGGPTTGTAKSIVQRARIALLFFVGAGHAAPGRVDVSDLFARRLSSLGVDIDWYLFSGLPGPAAGSGTFHGRPARISGRSRLPGASGGVASKLYRVLAAVHFFATAMRGQHNVIQVRDDFFAGLLGLLAARLRNRRFVFWLSYPFPEARLADAREGRARVAAYSWAAGWLSAVALYRAILPFCDHAFVQSDQMRRDVVERGADPRRLTVVPMGIPDEDVPFERPGTSVTQEHVVLYLGTLARVRRLDMIVRAFARVSRACPDARLVFVGEGDGPADRQLLENEVRRLGIVNRVTFTGLLPRAEALEWIRQAAVCLSPYYPTFVLRSTSPTKLIEYMALGKAVVANDHPEQAQILSESGAGACTAWDEEQFAGAVQRLLDDPSAREAAGTRGHRWVLEHRRYSVIAAHLRARYGLLADPVARMATRERV